MMATGSAPTSILLLLALDSIMLPLSSDTRDNILLLLQQPLSVRKVAQKCNVGKSTVQNLRAKHFPNLIPPSRGRPSKLSPQDKRFCVRGITSGRLETGVAVAKQLENDLNIKVCDRTVRRALQEAGLKAREKEAKLKLSPKNVRARLEFAKRH